MADNEELLAHPTDKQKEQQRLVSEKQQLRHRKRGRNAKAEAAKKQAAPTNKRKADAAKLEAEAAEESVKHQAGMKAVALKVQLVHPNRHQRQNHRQANHQHQELALVASDGINRLFWREPGASNLSATGIDLSKQSNVAAVDPSVSSWGH